MISYNSQDLLRAVAAICPDIKARVVRTTLPIDERQLWWELSTCILSSQVPYPLAVAAANAIDSEKILYSHLSPDEVMRKISQILSTPLLIGGRYRIYRFPTVRSRNLKDTYASIHRATGSLEELLATFTNAEAARSWFIKNAPGIGPKQASMFLRNAGISYELAILDRHVLQYMSAVGIYSEEANFISNFAKYRRYEAALQNHAYELGCMVGLLDWAIWIVMRVANRDLELTT